MENAMGLDTSGVISAAYESETARELIAAARLAPAAADALACVLQAEVDVNGELLRGQLSSERISAAECSLHAAAQESR